MAFAQRLAVNFPILLIIIAAGFFPWSLSAFLLSTAYGAPKNPASKSAGEGNALDQYGGYICLLYTSPSPRDLSTSRMPSSA